MLGLSISCITSLSSVSTCRSRRSRLSKRSSVVSGIGCGADWKSVRDPRVFRWLCFAIFTPVGVRSVVIATAYVLKRCAVLGRLLGAEPSLCVSVMRVESLWASLTRCKLFSLRVFFEHHPQGC